MFAMAAYIEKLQGLLSSGVSTKQLKEVLDESEAAGLPKELILNYPIPRYNGRTIVHLAASKGRVDYLKLFLNCGGKF